MTPTLCASSEEEWYKQLVSQLTTFNTLTVLFYRTADQMYNCRGSNEPNAMKEGRGEMYTSYNIHRVRWVEGERERGIDIQNRQSEKVEVRTRDDVHTCTPIYGK